MLHAVHRATAGCMLHVLLALIGPGCVLHVAPTVASLRYILHVVSSLAGLGCLLYAVPASAGLGGSRKARPTCWMWHAGPVCEPDQAHGLTGPVPVIQP